MDTFEIVNYYPIKGSGNMLGFGGLKFYINIKGKQVPQVAKIKIMRNSQTGHIFFGYHDEKYKDKDGNEKYSSTIRTVDKEDMDLVQKEFTKAWDAFVATKQGLQSDKPTEPYYPHGLTQNKQPEPSKSFHEKNEEIPF